MCDIISDKERAVTGQKRVFADGHVPHNAAIEHTQLVQRDSQQVTDNVGLEVADVVKAAFLFTLVEANSHTVPFGVTARIERY